MQNTIPYLVGGLTSLTSLIAQAAPSFDNPSLWIQAGMAGIVVVLLLKFFPLILSHQRSEAEANREIIREIVGSNASTHKEWQRVVSEKKFCPKDQNGN